MEKLYLHWSDGRGSFQLLVVPRVGVPPRRGHHGAVGHAPERHHPRGRHNGIFCNYSVMLVADYYLAIYLQSVMDGTPLESGVHMLPTTLGNAPLHGDGRQPHPVYALLSPHGNHWPVHLRCRIRAPIDLFSYDVYGSLDRLSDLIRRGQRVWKQQR
jgi:hypothetical protein